MTSLIFSSINVNGLRNPVKRYSLNKLIIEEKLDIVALQETHCSKREEAVLWSVDFPAMTSKWSFGSSKQNGVAFLISKRLNAKVTSSHHDDEGRLLSLTLTVGALTLTVTNVYCPRTSVERQTFLTTVVEPRLTNCAHVLLGDFNTVLDPARDRLNNPSARLDLSARCLIDVVERHSMSDLYRRLHPLEHGYTWKRPNGNQMSRIDMIFATDDVACDVTSVSLRSWQWSDHSALVVVATTQPSMPTRGPGYWHFNVSVLSDQDYCDQVKSFWTTWQQQRVRFGALADWWETGKPYLRDMTIQHCQRQAKTRRQRRLQLQRDLEEYRREIAEGNDKVVAPLRAVETELKALDKVALNGARVRSRIQWTEEGEKSSTFFFGLEKQKQRDNLITEFVDENGRSCKTTESLLKAAASFYERLYSRTDTASRHADRLLESINRTISDEQRHFMDSPITGRELREAANSMHANKSPGIDGLPIEFYRHFWSMISNDLIDVYNETLQAGRLSTTQRTGVVRLIHKKGERNDLRNWRPITLLTTDYKILAKALATRLTRVLPSVVQEDQTCGIPGRSIQDNCRLLQDIVDYCDRTDTAAGIVSLDQEKAFDRVSWQFLSRVLERMHFGPRFRYCIASLYQGISSRILVNGWLSSQIFPTRGVRQGCPLSPLLYVLVAESFSSLVRASGLHGLPLPNSTGVVTISQYADDTTVIITSDDDFTKLQDCRTTYELGSGAKLNMAKSRGLFLGPWRDRRDSPLALTWTNHHLKLLGVLVGRDPGLNERNWLTVIDKMKTVFRMWKHRDLSLTGRALIARVLATSKLWYVAHVVPPPSRLLDDINMTVWRFVWKDHVQLVTRRVCCRPPRTGGLGGVMIQDKVEALQLQWLSRLIDDQPAKWKYFAFYWLDQMGHPFTDHRGILSGNRMTFLPGIPPFYSSLMTTYRKYGGTADDPTTRADAFAQPLFGNPRIVDENNKLLFSRAMARTGLTTVGHLHDGNRWFDADRLQNLHQVGGHFLKRFLQKLHKAIPPEWLTLPDIRLQPQSLFIRVFPHPPISLTSKSMYAAIMDARDVEPLAVGQWAAKASYCRWTSALTSMRAANLHSPYSRDVAFKFMHRVLPTPHRLHRCRIAPSSDCPLCHHPDATLEHMFKRCPTARSLRIPLRRLLATISDSPVPSNVTLWSAPFLPNLSRSPAASFVVWTFVTTYWQQHNKLSLSGIRSVIASLIRLRITDDWYLCRRHRPPDVDFFRSQWMPPGKQDQLCVIHQDDNLYISLSPCLRLQ